MTPSRLVPLRIAEVWSRPRGMGVGAAVVVLVTVGVLYRASLGNFFYFDDFDFLRAVAPSSLSELASPLSPLQSNIYGWYRPISQFYYFVALRSLVGLEPAPYMLTNLTFLCLNVLLVFVLARQLTRQTLVASLAAQLYGVNFIHYEAMSWAVGIVELALTFFSLMTLLAHVLSVSRLPTLTRVSLRVLSVLAFCFALGSKETALMLPLWLALHFTASHVGRIGWRGFCAKLLGEQWVYYGLSIPFLILRWKAITAPAINEYAPRRVVRDAYTFQGIEVMLDHIKWFVRWILDEFLYPVQILKESIASSIHFGWFVWIAIAAALLIGMAGAVVILLSVRFRRSVGLVGNQDLRIQLLGLGWFIVGVIPVSFWPNQAAYYLMLPSIGAYLSISLLLAQILRIMARRSVGLAVFLFCLIWVGTTFGAFERVSQRQQTEASLYGNAIRQTLALLKRTAPHLSESSTVYLLDYPQRIFPGNSAESAIELFWDLPSARVVTGKSSETSPSQIDRDSHILRYVDGQVIAIANPP
jgi:hypothetical protein